MNSFTVNNRFLLRFIYILQHGANSHPVDDKNLSAVSSGGAQASGGASRFAVENVPEGLQEPETKAPETETEKKKPPKKTWNPFSPPRPKITYKK